MGVTLMKRLPRRILVLPLIAALVAGCCLPLAGCGTRAHQPMPLPAAGDKMGGACCDPAPDAAAKPSKEIAPRALLAAKLPDVQDNVKALSEFMGEGGLMLLFVDTRCPFSGTALKELPDVVKGLAGQKVNVVVLNSDDAKERVQNFYASRSLGAPILYDTGAATREAWNVHSVPIAVYVSPAMKIGYQGEAIWANLGSAVEQSLGLRTGAIKFTAAGTGFG